jgi:hypothetical protein
MFQRQFHGVIVRILVEVYDTPGPAVAELTLRVAPPLSPLWVALAQSALRVALPQSASRVALPQSALVGLALLLSLPLAALAELALPLSPPLATLAGLDLPLPQLWLELELRNSNSVL